MTKVQYKEVDEGYLLTAEGHANDDNSKEGSAVCTAISTLLQTLIQCLNECNGLIGYNYTCKGGDVKVFALPCANYNSEVKTYFTFTYIGLRLIERQYPQYITVK